MSLTEKLEQAAKQLYDAEKPKTWPSSSDPPYTWEMLYEAEKDLYRLRVGAVSKSRVALVDRAASARARLDGPAAAWITAMEGFRWLLGEDVGYDIEAAMRAWIEADPIQTPKNA